MLPPHPVAILAQGLDCPLDVGPWPALGCGPWAFALHSRRSVGLVAIAAPWPCSQGGRVCGWPVPVVSTFIERFCALLGPWGRFLRFIADSLRFIVPLLLVLLLFVCFLHQLLFDCFTPVLVFYLSTVSGVLLPCRPIVRLLLRWRPHWRSLASLAAHSDGDN